MIFLYLLAIFLSLFILYAVARHDFVLLRQSISLRTVFDNAFINIIVFFIVSRIIYIVYSGSFDFLNPLKFLYLTRHWGLLPFAGIVSIVLAVIILYRKKKNRLRILDIYFISITPVILLDVMLYGNSLILLAIKFASLTVLGSFYVWFIKIHNKFSTKDGFITMLTLITYALVTLAFSIAINGVFSLRANVFGVALGLVVILASAMLFLIQKDTFNKQ